MHRGPSTWPELIHNYTEYCILAIKLATQRQQIFVISTYYDHWNCVRALKPQLIRDVHIQINCTCSDACTRVTVGTRVQLLLGYPAWRAASLRSLRANWARLSRLLYACNPWTVSHTTHVACAGYVHVHVVYKFEFGLWSQFNSALPNLNANSGRNYM